MQRGRAWLPVPGIVYLSRRSPSSHAAHGWVSAQRSAALQR